MIINDETAVYHVMSRTALDGFPMGDVETPVKSATLFFEIERERRGVRSLELTNKLLDRHKTGG